MAPYPLSKDGSCPNCHSADVAYVLQPRHFAAGTLTPVFRILLKTGRAIVGLEQVMPVAEFPTMMCCGSCTMTPLRGGFNLDWRFTNLQSAFALTRDVIQDEERNPVDMRFLIEAGQRRLGQLHAVIPNSAPVVEDRLAVSQRPSSASKPPSLQDTIASTLRAVRAECEKKLKPAPIRKEASSVKNKTPTTHLRSTSTSERKSRWSSPTVQNVSLHGKSDTSMSQLTTDKLHTQEIRWKPFSSLSGDMPPSDTCQPDDSAVDILAEESRVQPAHVSCASVVADSPLCGESLPGKNVDNFRGQSPSLPDVSEESVVCSDIPMTSDPYASSQRKSSSEGDAGSDQGDSGSEPETCPDGVSSTVWQFYQQRVLRSKQTGKHGEEADNAGQKMDLPLNSCAEGDSFEVEGKKEDISSWTSVNVQELLRASNEKFSATFDQRSVKKRIAAVKRDARRSEKTNSSSRGGVGEDVAHPSRSLLSTAKYASVLLQMDSKEVSQPPSTVVMAEPDLLGGEVKLASSDTGAVVESDAGAMLETETGTMPESSKDIEVPHRDKTVTVPLVPVATKIVNETDVQSTQAVTKMATVSASPIVDAPEDDMAAGQLSFSSYLAGVSYTAYPYASVLSSSTAESLASIVPRQVNPGPVEVTSAPSTAANAAVTLSNLVSYSSDEDDSDQSGETDSPVTCDMASPSELEGWQVIDEETGDAAVAQPAEDQDGEQSEAIENSDVQAPQEAAKPVYPVSMTGACPYCYSSDVVYIILYAAEQPESQLPPLMRNLLLCGCAKKLPPPTGGEEVPSFQCRSCGYGFNLNWVATSLEAIFGVNDQPLDMGEEEVEEGISDVAPDSTTDTAEESLPSREADGWDIYWQQLTPQQQADYRRWYAANVSQGDEHDHKQACALDSVPSQTHSNDSESRDHINADKNGDGNGDNSKELAAKKNHLLSGQSEGVREFEALLNRIDYCRDSLSSNSGQPDCHKENETSDKSWWQIMATKQDPSSTALLPTPTDAQPSPGQDSVSGDGQSPGPPSTSPPQICEQKNALPPAHTEIASSSRPGYVTQYKDYTVQGCFNRHTGKFQKVADHWNSKGLSDDPGIRQMSYHFDTSELAIDPSEPEAKKARLSPHEVEASRGDNK